MATPPKVDHQPVQSIKDKFEQKSGRKSDPGGTRITISLNPHDPKLAQGLDAAQGKLVDLAKKQIEQTGQPVNPIPNPYPILNKAAAVIIEKGLEKIESLALSRAKNVTGAIKIAEKISPGNPLTKLKESYQSHKKAVLGHIQENMFEDPSKNASGQTIVYPDNTSAVPPPTLPVVKKKKEELQADIQASTKKLSLSDESLTDILTSNLAQDRDTLEKISQHMTAVSQWMKEKQEEEIEQKKLQNYNQGIDFLDNLGKVTRCKELQIFAQGARSALAIQQGISQLKQLNNTTLSSLGPSAILGPVGMIGGAILGFLGMFFGGGPDPSQIIIEKLDQLSDQMKDFQKNMHEEFKQVFANQKVILEVLEKGIHQLKQQFTYQISEVRVELGSSVQAVQASVNLLIKLTHGQTQDILLFDLEDLCASAENSLRGISPEKLEKRIPELTEHLAKWARVHSKNPHFNGIHFWRAWSTSPDPRLIHDYLKINDSAQSLVPLLGFLGHYAEEKRNSYAKANNLPLADYQSEQLPNPWVWLRAVNFYLSLKQEFVLFDQDVQAKLALQIKKVGEAGSKFIESVETDEVLWKSLFEGYEECLKSVKEKMLAYAKAKSAKVLKDRNNHCKPHQQHVQSLDLLGDPDTFIAQFNTRMINEIVGPIHTQQNNSGVTCKPPKWFDQLQQPTKEKLSDIIPFEQVIDPDQRNAYTNPDATTSLTLKGLSLKNEKPFYLPFATKIQTFLCAEYLGLLTFKAEQEGNLEGIKVANYVIINQKPTNFIQKFTCQVNPGSAPLPLKDLNGSICAESLNPDTNWYLSFKINAIFQQATQGVLRATYSGNWKDLKQINIDTKHVAYLPTRIEIYGRRENCGHAYTSENEKIKYGNHLVDFVQDTWDALGQGQALSQDSGLYNTNDEVKVKNEIKKEFFKQRQLIAHGLMTDTGSAEQQEFQKELQKLDLHVKMIQALMTLIGKKGKEIKLIHSGQIIEELTAFINYPESSFAQNLSTSLIPCLNTPVKPTIDDVKKLQNHQLSAHHPKRLLQAGLSDIDKFLLWKTLYVQQFPKILDRTTVEEYQVKCAVARDELFAQETYEMFKELNSDRFNDAKFRIQKYLRYFQTITSVDYTQMYLETVRWAIQKSKTSVATGGHADQLEEMEDLDDLKSQQKILLSLTRGWESNIGYLYQYALKFGNCPHLSRWTPVNFTMWADGSLNFLRLIYADEFFAVAEEAKNSPQQRLDTLEDILTCGQEVQEVIYTICLSDSLFKHLFNEYIAILQNTQKQIDYFSWKNPATVFAELKVTGLKIVGFNKIDAVALLLKNFLELFFAGDLEKLYQVPDPSKPLLEQEIKGATALKKLLHLKDKELIFKFFEKGDGDAEDWQTKSPSLKKAFQDYVQSIIDLQHVVENRIKTVKKALTTIYGEQAWSDLLLHDAILQIHPLTLGIGPKLLPYILDLLKKAQQGIRQTMVNAENQAILLEQNNEMNKTVKLVHDALRRQHYLQQVGVLKPLAEKPSTNREQGEIVEIKNADFANSCGLFAFALGIKFQCLLNKVTEDKYSFFTQLNDKDLTQGSERTQSINQELRNLLSQAIGKSEKYKMQKKLEFFDLCLQSINKKTINHKLAPHIALKGHLKHIIKASQAWLMEWSLRKNEIEMRIASVEIELIDILRLRMVIHRQLAEHKKVDFEQVLIAFPEQDDINRIIKWRKLMFAAWADVKLANDDLKNEIQSQMLIFFDTLFVEKSSNHEQMKIFATLQGMQFSSKGELLSSAPEEVVKDYCLQFYLNGIIKDQWNGFYEQYCKSIQDDPKTLITPDELGCWADALSIRLDLQYRDAKRSSTHPEASDLLHVKLRCLSPIHWQVYVEP